MELKFDNNIMALDDDKQQLYEEINLLLNRIDKRLHDNLIKCDEESVVTLNSISDSIKSIAYTIQHDEMISLNDVIRSRKTLSLCWDALANSWRTKKGEAA